MLRKKGLAIACAMVLANCSQPVLEIEEPRRDLRAGADAVLESTVVDPARNVHRQERLAAVGRVIAPVRKASYDVCMELEQPEERCDLMNSSFVTVYVNDDRHNAFADEYDEVHMLGGMVGSSGNDDEVAAVLAHEFAHIMLGHVEKKMKNAMAGMVLAAGITGATMTRGARYDQRSIDNILYSGYLVGSRAYSPEMEIESDRISIYVLHRAGFDPDAMRDVIVRMHRLNVKGQPGTFNRKVGFLQTHPSNDRRIAHILSAKKDAEAGVPLKVR